MSTRILRRRRAAESAEETVWISFSDLMTALLTVFMLAAVALVFSLTQEQDALTQVRAEAEEAKARGDRFDDVLNSLSTSEQVRAEMVAEIRDTLAAQGIGVEVDAAHTVIRVPVELLGFDSGSSDIRPQNEASALTIGTVIADALVKDERYRQLDTVFVEGHTDDVPMDSLYGGNWGLSSNRAISLWRLWEGRLPADLGGLTGHAGERLFSVSGYAETRPVNATQVTDADRAANRRIDIRFTEHRFSQDELAAIRDAAGADTA
ncbi:OmpA/MotB family protein [Cellulomonas xiejunii]|uniref:OmpA family protein n=1 Tax=Cellulomonas xiejunii TaxID=2968083 RepID=A0ABY5KQQ3_9CELL|nr:OmpA family protein [Cellulomonas xiejunii]MCC2319543.1 OmpA family protein [Cellulomonas xiejunii]UUI71511.1 OmpA family protein [Cellulomonas xiejunii]